MVKITKQEAMEIRKAFPHVHLQVTSKRKPARARTYWMTEEARLMRFLKGLRGEK